MRLDPGHILFVYHTQAWNRALAAEEVRWQHAYWGGVIEVMRRCDLAQVTIYGCPIDGSPGWVREFATGVWEAYWEMNHGRD